MENLSFAKRHGVLIIDSNEDATQVVHRASSNSQALLELRRLVKTPLQLSQVSDEEFESLLSKTYQDSSASAMQMAQGIGDEMDLNELINELPKTEDLLDSEDDAPIIKLINTLMSEAIKQAASDIHIETFEDNLSVRFRVDGVLREVLSPQRVLAPLIISRIKVMAKLDIAEKRIPQDGRITISIAGRAIDVRVSTIPASHGERIVLRLLDKKAAKLDLTELGMQSHTLKILKQLIAKPHGILLVTGPTGSGKTTSLYAALTYLNDVSRNILTVEDPIEYHLPGIGQTQVNSKVDMTFARGLRAILRQDPDVVMVGEIRDLETAEIAVQASLTGHLVLSTLHTNSAIGAMTRLKDMGIEPFLLASSLVGVAAQRLVRLLCKTCKQAYKASNSECELLGVDQKNPPSIYKAVGCDDCHQWGYQGRTGIYEVIGINRELRSLIHEDVTEKVMETCARKDYPSIRDDGCQRVLSGDTSIEEVLRVTSDD